MKKQNNNNNNRSISQTTVFEFLQSEKAPERAAIIRRMVEFLLGGKLVTLNTRSKLFVFYSVFAVTATSWWYWLRQVDRYRVETMMEQGLLEYDKKGKVVETEEYLQARTSLDVVAKVRTLKMLKRVELLEKHIAEYREEREVMREVIENQKRIEVKLQSLQDTLNFKK